MFRLGLTGYLAAAIAALTLALAGSGLLLKRSYTQLGAVKADLNAATDALEAVQEQRRADAAVLVARAASNAATGRETASVRAKLGRAAAKNRSWADAPLPQEVQDALK